MDISYNALQAHLDTPLPLAEVVAGFTQMGVEVEATTAQGDDTILALELTPNRPDLFCYRGLARELMAGLQQQQAALYQAHDQESLRATLAPLDGHIHNKLKQPSGCRRLFLREIRGITIKESPAAIKAVLESSGIKPKNNVVDLVNYVMLEMGQPMHACDRDVLSDQIHIRQASAGETVACLDGNERTLSDADMVIADDANTVIGIAGIMGSQVAEVKPTTSNLYIECAYFDPIAIRRTSKRLGLTTDSSRRFELGADPRANETAIDRVTTLILEHAGGELGTCYAYDAYTNEPAPQTLELPLSEIKRQLGIDIAPDFCLTALTRLGFDVALSNDNTSLRATPPSWRLHDIKYPICLVEEIAKVFDYNKIPNTFPLAEIRVRQKPVWQVLKQSTEQFFVSQGFNQAINFSFTSPDALAAFKPAAGDPLLAYVAIERPLNAQYTVLRTSQIPSLLANYHYNRDRGIETMKLFEMGRVFSNAGDQVKQRLLVSGLMTGPTHLNTWQERHRDYDSYDVKSLLFAYLDRLGIDSAAITVDAGEHCLFDPTRSGRLSLGEQVLGWFGVLSPTAITKKTKHALLAFELNSDVIKQAMAAPISHYQAPSKYPSIFRDLSFVCPRGFNSQTILDTLQASVGDLLKKITLSDVYSGKPIAKGYESLSFALEFNSSERTLSSDELTPLIEAAIQTLTAEHGLSLRDS